MKKLGIVALIVFLLAGFAMAAGSAWKSEDTSNPLVIYCSDQDDVVTVTIAAASFAIDNATDPTASTTVTVTSATTVSTIVGAINALTNASGVYIYKAVVWEALSTDTVTNKLLAASAVSVPNRTWSTVVKWDTSTALTYTVVPDIPAGTDGMPFGNYRITGLVGDIGGTGNVTVNVYENDTKIFQKTIVSPKYELPATWDATGTVTSAVIATVGLEDINLGPGLAIGSGKRGLVRATRATTATTGGIGAITGK